jgi:hypothetical protein
MKSKFENGKFHVDIDYSVENSLKSFKEEVLDCLYEKYKNKNIVNLMYSGGMDGTFILKSLLELGIKPELHTLSFSKDRSDYDSLLAINRSKKFGMNVSNFFYMDAKKIFKHLDFCTYEKKVAFPILNCYYVDYFLTENKDKNFFCGMSCEFRVCPSNNHNIILNGAAFRLKEHNPDRLHGFDNSRTFLSYVNNPVFKSNYLKKTDHYLYGENLWYARDLIYNDCYKDIEIIDKTPPQDNYIIPHFYNIQHKIQKMYPEVFNVQPYIFDVKNYFENKKTVKTSECLSNISHTILLN